MIPCDNFLAKSHVKIQCLHVALANVKFDCKAAFRVATSDSLQHNHTPLLEGRGIVIREGQMWRKS